MKGLFIAGLEILGMENNHETNKHLTYEERNFIEIGLNQGRTYTEIAKDISKDRRTVGMIPKEILLKLE